MKAIITIILLIQFIFSFNPSKTMLVQDSWFTNIDYTYENVYNHIQEFFPNNILSERDIRCIFWCSKVKQKINYEATILVIEKETRLLSNPYKNKSEYDKYYNIAMCVGLTKYRIVKGKKDYYYKGFWLHYLL